MLGIVTGLKSEARLVAGLGAAVISGGGQATVTRDKIASLIAEGVTGLVSFGIAGGLDPALPVGALVISDTVFDASGYRYLGDTAWCGRAVSAVPGAVRGAVYASDTIVESAAFKDQLFRHLKTVTADMESHHVARAAAQHGLPFIVIRAVSDTATEALPAAFGEGVDADGNTRVMPIIRALLTGRLSFPAVLRAGSCASQALRALRQARPALQQLPA